MKIALVAQPIDPVLPPDQNSIGIIVYELAKRLSAKHEVTVFMKGGRLRLHKFPHRAFTVRAIPTGPDRLLQRIAGKFRFSRSPRKPAFSSAFHFACYALLIALAVRKERFTVVHIVNFSQFVPIIRALNPAVKIVLHMECDWLAQLDETRVRKRVAKTDCVAGCSDFITERVRDRFPGAVRSARTLYNGVDTTTFFARDAAGGDAEQAQDRDVLFIGRVSPEKGIHTLIDALHRVSEERPGTTLAMIGPQTAALKEFIVPISDDPLVRALEPFFDGDYLRMLRETMDRRGQQNVRFLPSRDYSEMGDEYRKTKLFVFPSAWDEPFGMPVIESMACGTPVVITRSGGMTEFVQHGVTGLIVDREQPEELARAILALLEDADGRRRMGRSGAEYVKANFTWDRIAEQAERLYRETVQER